MEKRNILLTIIFYSIFFAHTNLSGMPTIYLHTYEVRKIPKIEKYIETTRSLINKYLEEFKTNKNEWIGLPVEERTSKNFIDCLSNFYDNDKNELNAIATKCKDGITFLPYIIKINIPAESRIFIIGDLHGNYQALLKIFKELKKQDPQNKAFYVFLGDYIDRGKNSLRVMLKLIKFKLKYFDRVFLLRGNHETFSLCCSNVYLHTLQKDIQKLKASIRSKKILLRSILFLFELLPLTLFIKIETSTPTNNIIQCAHANIDLRYDPTTILRSTSKKTYEYFVPQKEISLPFLRKEDQKFLKENYNDDPIVGFCWNDIQEEQNEKEISESSRGPEILNIGTQAISNYLQRYNISLLIRGHQHFLPKIINKYGITKNKILEFPLELSEENTTGICQINKIITLISASIPISIKESLNFFPSFLNIDVDERNLLKISKISISESNEQEIEQLEKNFTLLKTEYGIVKS